MAKKLNFLIVHLQTLLYIFILVNIDILFMTLNILKSNLVLGEKQRKFPAPNLTVKRSFTARNTGALSISVHGFDISGLACEGYGFRVLNCEPFKLPPNATRKVRFSDCVQFKVNLGILFGHLYSGEVKWDKTDPGHSVNTSNEAADAGGLILTSRYVANQLI